MLVAMLEIKREGERERGCDQDCSEVMMGWRDVWSHSEPRAAPAEGPSLTKVRDSVRTPRHSQGPPRVHYYQNRLKGLSCTEDFEPLYRDQDHQFAVHPVLMAWCHRMSR